MEVLHNGKYPDKNMIACDECNCIFRYYNSEILIETSSLEEQEAFCGYGVTKYIKCPQCGHKITTSCNFYPDPAPQRTQFHPSPKIRILRHDLLRCSHPGT